MVMEKFRLFILTLFYTFVSYSCRDKVVDFEIPTLIIDINEVTEGKASEYFESIDYVWMEDESDPDASIGVFHRLMKHRDRFYLFDEDMCICFYIFSTDGQFIRKVKGFGEGPGLYQSPSSFQVIDDTIRLNDISQRKILLYDLEGNWIKDTKQRIPANEIMVARNGFEFYHSESYLLKDSNNQVRVYDTEGKMTYEGFPNDERYAHIIFKNRTPFIELENGILFIEGYADTLYLLNQSKKKPFLAFDFRGKGFKNNDLKMIADLDALELINFINYNSPLHFDNGSVVNERFFMGIFRYQDQGYLGIYDFVNNESVVHKWGMINDIDLGPKVYTLSPLDSETAYGFTTGIDLYKHVHDLRSKMSEKEWEEFAKGKGSKLAKTALRAKNSENRVLIILKWKK